MKLNYGAGSNALPGWENLDLYPHRSDVTFGDITKPLPYSNGSADAIFSEHVVEHLTIHQAWNFFDECHRILRPGGLIRITVPSIPKIYNALYDGQNQDYNDYMRDHGWADGSVKSTIKAAIFQHGHQAIWSAETLITVLSAVGFRDVQCNEPGMSRYQDLWNLEGHGKVIGDKLNRLESVCCDGVK